MSPPGPARLRTLAVAGFLTGAAVRLLALPLPGTSDVPLFKAWAHGAATRGVTRVYGAEIEWAGRQWKQVNYPPLSMGLFALTAHAYGVIDAARGDSRLYTVLLKLPALLSDAGLAALLFLLLRPGGQDAARTAALAYWLNPAVVLDGAVLGYQDPVVALPAVAALAAAAAGRPALCGALAGSALLLKPQAVLLAPALLLALGADPRGAVRALTRAAAAAVLVGALVLAPFVFAGTLGTMVTAIRQLTTHDMYSADAANLWWLVTWAKRAAAQWGESGGAALTAPVRILRISMAETQGLPNPRPLGSLLVLAAAAWGAWRLRGRRDLGLLAALGAFVVHAYFTLGVGVHENHLYLAVPLLALAASLRPAFRGILLAVTAVTALNLDFIYGFGQGVGGALPRGLTGVDATVILAAFNVAAFAWHARVLAREAA
ncbi:MAG TPA: hypothetical protein VF310_01500 [Vicinamibacteria bacterium]